MSPYLKNIISGLVVFLIMVPPIYLCIKKRKGGELEKIDSQIVKRYDTMGRYCGGVGNVVG